MINEQAQFSKFSLQLDELMYLTLVLRLEYLNFSCTLTSGKGRRRDIKFKCSHADESACMHLEATWTKRRRAINRVDRGELGRNSLGSTSTILRRRRTSAAYSNRARFFHLSSEREAEVRSRDGRNERGRHGARKRWQRKPIWWLMRGSRQLSAFGNDREGERAGEKRLNSREGRR